MSDEKDDSLFKSKHYFDLGKAVDEVSFSQGAKETSIAGAKLLGKTLFNTVFFAGKAGVKIAKNIPGEIARQAENKLKENSDIEPEKKAKMQAYVKKYKRPEK